MQFIFKYFVFVASLCGLLLGACQSEKASSSETESQAAIEESPAENVMDCQGLGKLKFAMTYAEVESTFGQDKIINEVVPAGTEDLMEGIVSTEDQHNSFIRTEKGTIYISWKPAKIPTQINSVSFEPASPEQALRLPEGLKVGDSLADLLKANGEAIDFYGFGWQFGGLVISKKGKVLEAYPCLVLALGTADGAYEEVSDFMGDGTIRSDAPGLPLERIIITAISFQNEAGAL